MLKKLKLDRHNFLGQVGSALVGSGIKLWDLLRLIKSIWNGKLIRNKSQYIYMSHLCNQMNLQCVTWYIEYGVLRLGQLGLGLGSNLGISLNELPVCDISCGCFSP